MWYLPEMFDANALFATYTVALAISGLITIVLGSVDSGFTPLKRLGTVALGLLFLGYGVYLYLFLPETYWLAWYVFLAPVLVVVNVVKSIAARKSEREHALAGATAATTAPAVDRAPTAYDQA